MPIPYHTIEIKECGEPLVDLSSYPFILSPEYNKMGKTDETRQFLRESVADKLALIQATALDGYKFKIWDGWRPRWLQLKMFNEYKDELRTENPSWNAQEIEDYALRFWAKPDDPAITPHHSTGGAVDLTLVYDDGAEVDMGGLGFDDFRPQAAYDYYEKEGRDLTIRDNRRILYKAMADAGFQHHPNEWWHYDYGDQRWALLSGADFAYYGEITNSAN